MVGRTARGPSGGSRADEPMMALRADGGTYALLLESDGHRRIRIGRKYDLDVESGHYLYIGSAFGPGGVRARLRRHCRSRKSKRWHVDYLRAVTAVRGAWIDYGPVRLEHEWAATLCDAPGLVRIDGFGCSDCACPAHLFFSPSPPRFATLVKPVTAKAEYWTFAPWR